MLSENIQVIWGQLYNWCRLSVTCCYFRMRGLISLALSLVIVQGKIGFGPTDQDWGFVTVRDNAHIFWWLHYTRADVAKMTDRPLVIWLQGGPGSSSAGYGNFAELGPLDTNLQPRNYSWDHHVNLLFVDSPVGTGFSYVDDLSALTTNNTQIAVDFLVFLKAFFHDHSMFKGVPLYIFSESYGGKMGSEIASLIVEERNRGNIECNLTTIALGDAWISPIDSVLEYAPYLLSMGIIDQTGYKKISKIAELAKRAVDSGRFEEAFGLWRGVEYEIKANTYGVDMYNVLNMKKGVGVSKDLRRYPGQTGIDPEAEKKVIQIMNGPVKEALNLHRDFGTQNDDVWNTLTSDFMTPVTHIVEQLLNTTDLSVVVYTGQLDLIVDTPGTVQWVENLRWTDKSIWEAAERAGFVEDGYYEGYVKRAGKFVFYWVDRSGHMVPADNPTAMYHILKEVTNNFQV